MAKREQGPYVLHHEPPATKVTPAFQRVTDRMVRAVLLWVFPRWIKPNYLTFLRLLLIPVILVLLALHLHWWAFGVFVAAISTDFIDGAMARTRGQISILGTYIDPIADKLLIGSVFIALGYQYWVVRIIVAFIVLELVLSAIGIRILLRTGSAHSSNAFGKSKMVAQSVALLLFLIAGFVGLPTVTRISLYLLWLALALAVVSGLMQIQGVRHPPQPTKPVGNERPSGDQQSPADRP